MFVKGESKVFKLIFRNISLGLALILATVTCAKAQSASASFALGTATDGSNNQSLDTYGDVGPSLGGLFMTIAGDVMVKPTIGFGAEYSFHADQTNYAYQAGVNYRPDFYDFNAVLHPLGDKSARVVPEFQGGLGGVNMKFYETETGCAVAGVCSTLNEYIASSNHFQLHFAGGVRFFITHNLYIKPQIDVHWVNNFQEFNSGWVPEYTAAIGYSFGGTH
jgi:hypothetical protein